MLEVSKAVGEFQVCIGDQKVTTSESSQVLGGSSQDEVSGDRITPICKP